ncbi:hypothetical protein CPB84DRAFT_1851938 [Gymnopilus junonius]|uniref:Uncharacterized protein n=1 Tax=Gymnopilus junonius TaxID=109634 RepID=A0A9P5NBE4_GYMJU|nr:hypothetical protein CPB84DRAFT_1851938 [Gymnopilus junonius]
MADGLLLYRCYVIWNSNIRVILFPLFLYVAELATGIAVPIEVALTTVPSYQPAQLTFRYHGFLWGAPSRLFNFTNLEAALPLSLAGIAFAVCVGQNFYPKVPFAHIWGMLVAIAPQSIILRVAMGHAWTENAFNQSTNNIEFARGNNITQKSQEYSTPDVFRVKLEDGPKETV